MTIKSNITAEENLLLELCRIEFNEEHISRIKSAISSISDWKHFGFMANEHGIAALVYSNLEKCECLKNLDKEVINTLHSSLLKSLSRNVFFTKNLYEIIKALHNDNIKTVLLKGVALELTVYGNSGLRQMTDTDILIAKSQCRRASEIITRMGYKSLPVKSFLHEYIIEYTGKHLPSLQKDGLSVEIHNELFGDENNLLTKKFYESSVKNVYEGVEVYIPEPQIFFLYLIRHLHVHETKNESQLRLYADLIIMIDRYKDKIINDNLFMLASDADMISTTSKYLGILRDIWNISYTKKINELVIMWDDPDVLQKFLFFLKNPRNNSHTDKARFYRNIIKEIPGLHRKLLYILGDIFPSISFMKKRYKCTGAFKASFYYPHRLGKILWLLVR